MLEIDGIPPKLSGRECEALICQQYWYHGKLANEVDMLCIKAAGRWHALYFENGTVFWRLLEDAPNPVATDATDPFHYPQLDLGGKYALNGQFIDDCVAESLPDGARVVIRFEQAGMLVVTSLDNRTRIQYVATAY